MAEGLGLTDMPPRLNPAREPVRDLEPSPALSITLNGPGNLSGRKLGVLLTDGAEASVLGALLDEAGRQNVVIELVAPTVRGVKLSNGKGVGADQALAGGPSVLYDAVAVLASPAGAAELAKLAAARDFVTDAYNHSKFIGYAPAAASLFEVCGISGSMDRGFFELARGDEARNFLDHCAPLRFWDRHFVSAPTP